MTRFFTGLILVSTMLTACTTGPNGGVSNENVGTVAGGVLGGFLGSQFGEGGGKTAAAIGGALLGAWAGKQVAKGMTAQDNRYHEDAAYKASTAPVGETINWYNPDSGHSGSITPVRVGQTSTGAYCREFQQTVTIDGQTERAYGTACQQPDGTWQIM